jgi:hypothetical protein
MISNSVWKHTIGNDGRAHSPCIWEQLLANGLEFGVWVSPPDPVHSLSGSLKGRDDQDILLLGNWSPSHDCGWLYKRREREEAALGDLYVPIQRRRQMGK